MAQAISTKKFSIAGTSNFNGTKTFRFANGDLDARVTALKHFGHTNIHLEELPRKMTKVQAIAHLISNNGTRAILPTRSPDKRRKSPIQLMGEELAGHPKAKRGRPAKAATAEQE